MPEASSAEKAFSFALRYLSYRPRSEFEVRQRLQGRYQNQVTGLVIARLKQQGLLDDKAFAHAWSQSRISSRPRSALLIRRELLRKGVDQETAKAEVATLDDETSAYDAALRGAKSLSREDYTGFRRRMWGYLYGRGYGKGVILRTVRRLWEEGLGKS